MSPRCGLFLATLLFVVATVDAFEEEKRNERLYQQPITISGVAQDEDDRPVGNAKVYLLSTLYEDFRRVAETTTDVEGNYRFDDEKLPMVRPEKNTKGRDGGAFEILGVAKGYGFAWRPRKICVLKRELQDDRLMDVDPPAYVYADEEISLDLEFPEAAKVQGRIVDERGRPIDGVKVQLRYCARIHEPSIAKNIVSSGDIYELTAMNQPEDVPVEVKVRLTDDKGRFEFTDLPAECLFRIDLRHKDYALRDLWAATTSRKLPDLGGKSPIQTGDFELTFERVHDAKVLVVYEDSGQPAPDVSVYAGRDRTYSSKTSDEHGEVTLRLPVGEYKVQILPATGTPYLITEPEDGLLVTEQPAKLPAVFELRRACVLDVTIVDDQTGEGLADVDLWIDRPGNDFYFRSFQVPRLANVERPVSDKDGKLKALAEPGIQRFGASHRKLPAGYAQDRAGQELDCQAGETLKVVFRLKRGAQPEK